jgi:EAL domain-containing protein (putative c-di-GMP-specific phosphodiesterase class I)
LKSHGVAPEDVTLEITESSVVDAAGNTLAALRQLRDFGLHIAIDDFGTGYSSLSSLRHMPADIVKIDRSFVSGLGGQDSDEAIVRAVLAMAHATDRIVVAEGVETEQQATRLVELGCDQVQGFLFSPPVPAIDFDPRRHFHVPRIPQQRMSQPARDNRPQQPR